MAFICSVCDKALVSKSNLRVHMRIHSGERPFRCHKCTKAFTQAGQLEIHERTHTGERPFKCHQCAKTFTKSCNLKRHERTHTGERPYICDKCNKTFILGQHLKNHKRTHTGERPYKCDKCNKTFTFVKHLKLHELAYTRERYTCHQCTKTFKRADHLKFHERTHTRDNNCTSSNNNEMKCSFKNSQLEEFPQPNTSAINLSIIQGKNGYSYQVYQNKFPRNYQMTHHQEIYQRTPTTARPFKCTKCNKDYTEAHHLKYHPCTHIIPLTNISARHLDTIEVANRDPYQVYHNKFLMMTYDRAIHSADEANHSMSSSNIQSSRSIHPEKHSFQYEMPEQNVANYPNLSTRFNAIYQATFPHQFISQNIQSTISPLDINMQTQGSQNISTLNKRQDTNRRNLHMTMSDTELMN